MNQQEIIKTLLDVVSSRILHYKDDLMLSKVRKDLQSIKRLEKNIKILSECSDWLMRVQK